MASTYHRGLGRVGDDQGPNYGKYECSRPVRDSLEAGRTVKGCTCIHGINLTIVKFMLSTRHQAEESRSLADVHSTVGTSQVSFWKRMFAFAGPAYLVSVGYMDPGNWATDLEGGARFGYPLLWVLVMSNAMAVLLQTLSARLGIVAGPRPGAGVPGDVSAAGAIWRSGSCARSRSRRAIWRRCWARPSG